MLWVTACLLLPMMMDVLLSSSGARGLPSANERLDCVRASEQCLKEQGCSSKYRTLRQCAAGKEGNFSKVDMKDECKNATEELRQKSLSNCRCRRGMKKEKNCLRIYWSMYQSLQGNDLLEESPYEPVNSRLSDIFRLAPITSGALQTRIKPRSSDDQRPADTIILKVNNCLDAAKACNLNDTCKKYRSAYITPCTSKMSNEVCNRRKCHKALRQFFDKVPPKHSYGMLFCACKDTACTERRRQTIVPVCLYEANEKANCLSLQESCKTNYICRSRLVDFFTNCQSEPRSASGCLKENYGDCLLSYSGLIGTVMTPNYVDTTSLRVAPWCDCSNSGNTMDECQKFLNFFMENTCLQNAIQAFGNGTDVWQQSGPPLQTTTATTTVGIRTKPRVPLPGPDNSNHLNNEIPTDNNLPACANLQAQKLNSNDSSEAELCLLKADGKSRSGHMSSDNSSAVHMHAHHCTLLVVIAVAHSIRVMLHTAPTS